MLLLTFETSEDPVLDILRTDLTSVYDKVFSSYIFLLFGELDENIASWFSRAILSIDSLTGEDIGCFVFAKKIRIRTNEIKTDGRRLKQYVPEAIYYYDVNEVPLYKIMKTSKLDNLIVGGKKAFSGNEREISAITQGTDIVARELGVVDKLPCMIIIDSLDFENKDILKEEGNMYTIDLDQYSSKQILKFLRTSVGSFLISDNLKEYKAHLRSKKETIDIRNRLKEEKGKQISKLQEIKNNLNSKVNEIKLKSDLKKLASIITCLENGSIKILKKELNDFSFIENKEQLLDNFSLIYQKIIPLSRSISTLEYHLNKKHLHQQPAIIKHILEKHIYKQLSFDLEIVGNPSNEVLLRVLDDLKKSRNNINSHLFDLLPDEEEIKQYHLSQEKVRISNLNEEELKLKSYMKEINDQLDTLNVPSQFENPPSLVTHFKNSIESNQINRTVKWDYFIAHSSKDNDIAQVIYNNLSKMYNVFLDIECLQYGDDWDMELHNAQINSQKTLVIVTNNTSDAYYQRAEIARAINLSRKMDKRVIPVLINTKETHYGLELKHSIYVNNVEELKQYYDQL